MNNYLYVKGNYLNLRLSLHHLHPSSCQKDKFKACEKFNSFYFTKTEDILIVTYEN